MNNTELLVILRSEVSDEAEPYLWSNTLLYGYIDDAQKQFCRLGYGIEDARSFRLNLTLTKEWYPLDPRILKIRKAYNQTTNRSIPVVALEKMAAVGLYFSDTAGPTRALITGMEKGQLRAVPMPSVVGVVELWVFCLSQTMEVGGDFEIDEQHVRNLLLWLKHRCYEVQDSEVYDKRKSAEYKDRFEEYCFKAKAEQDRLNRPASTVAYGGI